MIYLIVFAVGLFIIALIIAFRNNNNYTYSHSIKKRVREKLDQEINKLHCLDKKLYDFVYTMHQLQKVNCSNPTFKGYGETEYRELLENVRTQEEIVRDEMFKYFNKGGNWCYIFSSNPDMETLMTRGYRGMPHL